MEPMLMTRIKMILLLWLGAAGSVVGLCALASLPATQGVEAQSAPVAVSPPQPVVDARPVAAQIGPPRLPAKEKEKEARLEVILREWAKATEKPQAFRSQFRFTRIDLHFDTGCQLEGEVLFVPPDLLRIDYRARGKPVNTLVFKEQTIHHYDFANHIEKVYPRPKERQLFGPPTDKEGPTLAAILDGSLFAKGSQKQTYWYFRGLPVRELKSHFDIQLVKEDRWYLYLELLPRSEKAKLYCKRMRVVLTRENYWTRQLWSGDWDGNESTIDFTQTDITSPAQLRKAIMEGLPGDWKRMVPGDWKVLVD
jgi:hypothetical protein